MALIDELKDRADKLDAELLALSGRIKEIERESNQVHTCINALHLAEMKAEDDGYDDGDEPEEPEADPYFLFPNKPNLDALDFAAEKAVAREQLEREPEIPEGFDAWTGTAADGPIYDFGPHTYLEVAQRSGARLQGQRIAFHWTPYGNSDDIIAYRIIEPARNDDASEFAFDDGAQEMLEESYAPGHSDADLPTLTGDPAIEPESGLHDYGHDGFARHVEAERPALDASMHDEREQPVQTEPDGYAPVTNPTIDDLIPEAHRQAVEAERYALATNPDADERAKLNDWYDPKAVHERQKFNPFGIFGHKRETEEVS